MIDIYDCDNKKQELDLVNAKIMEICINEFIKIGNPITILPADNLMNGCLGFVIFCNDNDGKEHASNPLMQFRPKVSRTVECESKSEYEGYYKEALEKKWIVQVFDDPRRLTKGFTVQNSDEVVWYTIRLTVIRQG